MSRLNFDNRTLAVMDNLRFLESLNNECIDLIAIDPPFAANETFTGHPRPPISDAELAEERALAQAHGVEYNEGQGDTRVKDVWTWDADVNTAWKMAIQYDYPKIHAVVEAVEACASENEAAYISFMAARLIHCHRVLKPTGSIYIHCDDHANSYLRMLMDAIFGADNFRNELMWRRATSHNDSGRYGRITDYLLYYAKSPNPYWDGEAIHTPKSDAELQRAYPSTDERGRFRSADLTGAGVRMGESGRAWKGYEVTDRARHWAIPRVGKYAEYIERNFIPGYRGIQGVHERLDALDAAGRFAHPSRGRWPGLKRYADADQGNPPQNLILNPTGFTNFSASGGEFTGYATQKPLELYERVIKASSREGDAVLDIFAGCATTAVAAERLNRQWIACDMAYRSWTMLKRRFYLNGYALSDMTDSTPKALMGPNPGLQTALQEATSRTIGPADLPSRDDEDPVAVPDLRPVRQRGRVQNSTWSGRIPKEEAKDILISEFGHRCWGCGYEPRRPNGTWDDTLLEIDHIRARKAAEGRRGNDELYNLALLHRTCNGIKRNSMTLEELRAHNIDNMMLYVDSPSDLVDLYAAQEFATEHLLNRETDG